MVLKRDPTGDIDDLPGRVWIPPLIKRCRPTKVFWHRMRRQSPPPMMTIHVFSHRQVRNQHHDPPEDESRQRTPLLMGLLVLVAIGGVIGGLVVAEIGPFAPEEKPQVKRKKPKPRKKKVKKPAPIPGRLPTRNRRKKPERRASFKPRMQHSPRSTATAQPSEAWSRKKRTRCGGKGRADRALRPGLPEYPENRRWLQSGIEVEAGR